DVEVAGLAKIEEPLVEPGPRIHAAQMHVVRQMIDRFEADAGRVLTDPRQRHEIDLINGAARTIPIDEVDEAAADPLDRRDVEFHRPDTACNRFGAPFYRAVIGRRRVGDAKRDGAYAGTVKPREALRETLGLGVDDEVDIPLAVERHPF